MTEWIDFAVYAALMLTIWFGIPTTNASLTVSVVADRNPAWLAAHPEAAKKLTNSRWFLWSCHAMGALSLGALLSVTLGMWSPPFLTPGQGPDRWMVLWNLSTVSGILGVVYFGVCGVLFVRWLHRDVPLAERRHATLERRSINDFVPRGVQLAVYTTVALHLAVWLAVGVLGRYSTPAFWGTLAFQFIISAIFLAFVHAAVGRRPSAADRIFGPGLRGFEVRCAFAAQLLPLMNGIARLYEEATGGIPADVNRFLQLGLVALIVLGFVSLVLAHRFRWIQGAPSPSARVLVICVTALLSAASSWAQSPAAPATPAKS